MANTGPAVQFLTELVNSKDVTGTQADMWITSLALIHYPSIQMLEQVKVIQLQLLLHLILANETIIPAAKSN